MQRYFVDPTPADGETQAELEVVVAATVLEYIEEAAHAGEPTSLPDLMVWLRHHEATEDITLQNPTQAVPALIGAYLN
jgi:hypothetical protein